MRTDAYTAEAICKCMGITSFEHDPVCTQATEAIRLLLKPSFHPEVCITFANGSVSVVSARSMIWHLSEPTPMITDRSEGLVPEAALIGLLASMVQTTSPPDAVRGVILDGMPVELLHFRSGGLMLKVGGNGGRKGDFSAFIAQALSLAWDSIASPYCRNALAAAAEYVGQRLPQESEPARKPIIETLMLGPEEDRAQLMAALKRHHGGGI